LRLSLAIVIVLRHPLAVGTNLPYARWLSEIVMRSNRSRNSLELCVMRMEKMIHFELPATSHGNARAARADVGDARCH